MDAPMDIDEILLGNEDAVSQEANSIVNELRGTRSRADSERTNDTFAHPDLQNSSNRRHQQTKNQLVSSQRQNQEVMHNNRLLQLKLEAKSEELEKVKKELNEHSMNLHSNCFSRRDHGRAISAADAFKNPAAVTASELMHCRCPGTRCTFVAQSNPSIKSYSPTQWIRMKRLLSKYPILKDRPKVVKFLTQGNTLSKLNVPIETGPPTKDEFLELANCQTMFLMVEDMPDWRIAFDNSTAQILEEIVGKELLNPKKPLTLVTPGCHQEDVPLNNSNMLQFDDWKKATATLQNVLQNKFYYQIIIILPYDSDKNTVDNWKKIIDVIPETSDILLIPVPTPRFNHLHVQPFVDSFNEVMNGKPEGTGKWDMLNPSTPVIEENGRALVLLREVLSAEETWKMIYEKLKERGFHWPGFRIKGPEPIQEIRRHEFSGKENGKSTEPRGKHPASRSRASSVAPIPKRRHQY